jgi:hypothetical protein
VLLSNCGETCDTFIDVPPLVHWTDGSTCLNPDYNAISKFHRSALAIDVNDPTRNLRPDVLIAPGDTANFQLTVEREENGMGHFLINELLVLTQPANATGLLITIKDQQNDRVFMNEAVYQDLLLGNAHLNCCLPCPIMLFPNQTLVFEVTNTEGVDVQVRIVARGQRFMPYHNQPLVGEMVRCWNGIPAMPYWLTLDDVEVTIPGAVAGVPGRLQAQMTVPGGGWFEMLWPRTEIGIAGNLHDGTDILVNVTEGRIGRRAMNEPVNMLFYATPTLAVAGFPGNHYRSASACHCPPPAQVYRANTRIIHDFQNLNADPATVRLTYAGCYYFVDRCPPQRDLSRVQRGECLFDASSLVLEPDWECEEPPVPVDVQEPLPEAPEPTQALPAPESPRIVNMYRPSGRYYGPGSAPNLPWKLSYGVDQYGKTHVVVRDPNRNTFVRFATARETPSWAKGHVDQKNKGLSGMSGLGRGDWERI